MAKPTARIAAIQFGFAVGILARADARGAAADRRGGALGGGGGAPAHGEGRCSRRGAARSTTGTASRSRSPRSSITSAWRPNELEDVRAAFVLLVRNLGVSAPALNREFQARKRWIYLHGPFNATQVQALRRVNGIHLTGEFQRFYPSRELARPIIGGARRPIGRSAGRDSRPRSTRCSPAGRARRFCSRTAPAGATTRPGRKTRDPVRRQRRHAHDRRRAAGDRRARAGRRDRPDGGRGWRRRVPRPEQRASCWRWPRGRRRPAGCPARSTFTDPFEPGSTAKLFTAAALLMHDRVQPTDAVSGENGVWNMPTTSTGHDPRDHRRPRAARHAHAGARDPGLEQHRDGQVLLAASPRGAVRDAARLRLRHADGRRVSGRVARHPGAARIAGSRCTPGRASRWATSSA